MFSLFRRAPAAPDVTAWWSTANALAESSPSADDLAALRATMVPVAEAPDLAEAQEEMLDGLEALARATFDPLPRVATQHRVIGADVCHYLTPASLVDQVDAGGKLFVTSARLVFAGGGVQAWAWHLVARVQRVERDVLVELKGRPPVQLRLNSYEDALMIRALAGRLCR